MANPIAFKPAPVDPKLELEKRLAAAPREHAEALLVAWDVLQSAHDKGLLDMLHGAIEAKDAIAGKVAEYAKEPEGIAGIRNLLAALKILTAIDPEVLDRLSRAMQSATEAHGREMEAPSLLAIVRRAGNEDSRRGLSFLTLALENLGRALKG